MAKRPRQQESESTEQTSVTTAAVEKIEEFADDLGQLLGHARGKAESWLAQRQSIVNNLTELRDTATRLLADLGHQAQEQVAKVTGKRRGRPPVKKKGRPTPEETRRRVLSAEARKRWAAMRAKAKK
jgi:ElaB/YqjD/DUF883 family membrane-anchored ribosome-binding protein